MQQPLVPFWFKQRQCKAEPAGDNVLKLTGPNLGEAFIVIRQGETGRWQAVFRTLPSPIPRRIPRKMPGKPRSSCIASTSSAER